MKRAPRVSLCLIARNEEPDVEACIGSAMGAVDEVIVVDTGSTDRTAELARAAGARVATFAWRDDFAAARNRSLEEATGDWALVLDADERLEAGSADRIRRAVADPKTAGYRTLVVSDLGGGVQQPVRIVRLFRLDPAIRFERRIHESVNRSLVAYARARGERVLDLPVSIRHGGYTPECFERKKKRARNLALHRLQLEEQPNDAYAWYRLGDELRAVDMAQARDALRRAASILDAMSDDDARCEAYASEVFALLAFDAIGAGDAAAALAHCEQAAARHATTPNLLYARASAHARAGLSEESLADFRALRALDGRPFEMPSQNGATTWLAHLGAAEALEGLGRLDESDAEARAALALHPTLTAAAILRSRVLNRAGRAADARAALDDHLRRAPSDGWAWAASGRIALEAGAPEVAAKRLAIAASSPNAPAGVLEDLAIAHALAGDAEAARAAAERLPEGARRGELLATLDAPTILTRFRR